MEKREGGSTATDPRTDDLTFTREWGDGSAATTSTHLNGGTSPFTATDEETHVYAMAGTHDLKVTVRDDGGGSKELTVTTIVI